MDSSKGSVCVTGGKGFVGSWLIMKLLQHGYAVNTTIRSEPECKKDISYLTSLPGASDRLQIFIADLDKPEQFDAAIKGCIGVFHVAHPIDFEGKGTEEVQTKRSINGMIAILQSCLNSKTVKRVVYTSSASTVEFSNKDIDIIDENVWSDVNYIRRSMSLGATYMITKTLTEKAALEFAEKHGLDLVSVLPSWITGPFLTPHCASSVRASMALIFGEKEPFEQLSIRRCVHTDDVASAHIFLFEYPAAKGRYICSAVEISNDKLSQFLSTRYPEYHIKPSDSIMESEEVKNPSLSSKKLLDIGFKYKYGLEEMYDEAIECCKQKGFL